MPGPPEPVEPRVTEILSAYRKDPEELLRRVVPLLQPELRRIASDQRRKFPDQNMYQTTSLVNEAYLRLAPKENGHWKDGVHFKMSFRLAVYSVLVDHARRRSQGVVSTWGDGSVLDDLVAIYDRRNPAMLELETTLERLQRVEPLYTRVVELRAKASMTFREVGDVLGLSEQQAFRTFQSARAWLRKEIEG